MQTYEIRDIINGCMNDTEDEKENEAFYQVSELLGHIEKSENERINVEFDFNGRHYLLLPCASEQ